MRRRTDRRSRPSRSPPTLRYCRSPRRICTPCWTETWQTRSVPVARTTGQWRRVRRIRAQTILLAKLVANRAGPRRLHAPCRGRRGVAAGKESQLSTSATARARGRHDGRGTARRVELDEGAAAFDRFRAAVKTVLAVPKGALPPRPRRKKKRPLSSKVSSS
jgi:hypothetical protein